MGKNSAKSFILIGCILIGILLTSSIDKTSRNFKILNAFQYKEAIDERYKLKKEIESLSENYASNKIKIDKYGDLQKSNSEVLNDIIDELNKNKELLGTKDLEGPGIEIELRDGTAEYLETYDMFNLIHDQDMIQVINDVRNSGAEAIAINGIRIIDRTEIYCNGVFLRINGVKVAAPFYITAIGNKNTMKKYLLSPENYLSYLQVRNIYISIEDKEKVKVTSFQGKINFKYMK